MKRIFVSYSRKDVLFASQLAIALSEVGADVWIDIEDIPAGMKWSTAVQEGLDTADAMLVILSPDSMESKNVEDEWQYFKDHGKPVIPLWWRSAKVHFQLHRLQYIDFQNQVFGDAFAHLIDELNRQGVELEVEEAEATAVFVLPTEIQMSLPRPTVASPPASSSLTPSMTAKQPVVSRFASLPKWIVGGITLILVLLAVYIMLQSADSQNAELFQLEPMQPIVYENNDGMPLHASPEGSHLFPDYVYEADIVLRMIVDGAYWYQVHEWNTDRVGWQTPDLINIDGRLLSLVPIALDNAESSALTLYQTPATNAPSITTTAEGQPLIYGYVFDDAGRLWYRVEVPQADSPKIGWLRVDSTEPLPNLPVIANVPKTGEAYLDDDAISLEPDTELRIVEWFSGGDADNWYKAGLFFEGSWVIILIPESTVALNEVTHDYLVHLYEG